MWVQIAVGNRFTCRNQNFPHDCEFKKIENYLNVLEQNLSTYLYVIYVTYIYRLCDFNATNHESRGRTHVKWDELKIFPSHFRKFLSSVVEWG
jgi:hypothetical protein